MSTSRTPAEAPLILSISGVRGIVGESMTAEVACRYAGAFGAHLREHISGRPPVVALGRDSRPSGRDLLRAAAAGLNSVGCRVVDLGIQATPTVGVMIEHRRADGGVVITASHNPAQWNGVKCLDHRGVAPPPAVARRIIERFDAQGTDDRDQSSSALDSLPDEDESVGLEHDSEAVDVHINRILEQVHAEPIRAAQLRVVLDSVNGAGGAAGRVLLDSLGVEVIHLNAEPHGRFAHPPEPLAENLGDLGIAVVEHGADVGFAQDPDADRLAIVDETGRYIGEEYTLVLCALRVLEGQRPPASSGSGNDDRAASPRVVAANLSTSRMIDDLAARYPDVVVLRSAVGEANVVEAMQPHGLRAVIGGEGNGGVIYPPVCRVRDSISSMALVLSLLAERRLRAVGADDPPAALSSIVNSLPRYTMIKRKFDLTELGGRDAVEPMLKRVRDHFAAVDAARIDEADGVRIDFDDRWVHLRPSNTEPIVRLIAEARTQEAAEELRAAVMNVVGKGRTG